MIIKIKELTEDISLLEQEIILTPDQIENSKVCGAVVAKAVVSHLSDKIYLDISFSCNVERVCGRCTDEFLQEVCGKVSLFLQERGSDDDFDGEIVFYEDIDAEVDLRESIYEQILLETPIVELCREDCKGLVDNNPADEVGESIDPRWEALRKLKK